jgi:hypothetical protein
MIPKFVIPKLVENQKNITMNYFQTIRSSEASSSIFDYYIMKFPVMPDNIFISKPTYNQSKPSMLGSQIYRINDGQFVVSINFKFTSYQDFIGMNKDYMIVQNFFENQLGMPYDSVSMGRGDPYPVMDPSIDYRVGYYDEDDKPIESDVVHNYLNAKSLGNKKGQSAGRDYLRLVNQMSPSVSTTFDLISKKNPLYEKKTLIFSLKDVDTLKIKRSSQSTLQDFSQGTWGLMGPSISALDGKVTILTYFQNVKITLMKKQTKRIG